MELKGMMFAGGGLMISMVATTIWISGDVTRMREQEQAKRAQECATQTPAASATTGAIDPMTGLPVAQAGAGTDAGTDPQCVAPANGTTTIDPATGQPVTGTVDPTTGQPVGGAIDPTTGALLDQSGTGAIDPNTGAPIGASSSAIDPNTGLPLDSGAGGSFDPNTGAPVDSTVPDPSFVNPSGGDAATGGL